MAVSHYIYGGAGVSLYALILYFHACLCQIQLECIFNFVCMSISNTTGAAFVTVDLWSNSSMPWTLHGNFCACVIHVPCMISRHCAPHQILHRTMCPWWLQVRRLRSRRRLAARTVCPVRALHRTLLCLGTRGEQHVQPAS